MTMPGRGFLKSMISPLVPVLLSGKVDIMECCGVIPIIAVYGPAYSIFLTIGWIIGGFHQPKHQGIYGH
jgi:hypothetical protein